MFDFDPDLDLSLERQIDVPPATLWRCWTEPELLMIWFCPKPWQVTRAVIDLRPGGRFYTHMEGPGTDGSDPNVCDADSEGCFLSVDPGRELVFTDALRAGWRPNPAPFMTATVRFAPKDGGTWYTARVQHVDAAGRARHEQMGFFEGWGTAADQMEALARTL